jgi:hypothetical protein
MIKGEVIDLPPARESPWQSNTTLFIGYSVCTNTDSKT